MKIKHSEIRRDYTLDYKFEGEIVTVTYEDDKETITDEFDFSQLQEDDKIVDVETDIPVRVVKSAEIVGGEIEVELMKPYGANIAQEIMNGGDFPFSRNWQEVG